MTQLIKAYSPSAIVGPCEVQLNKLASKAGKLVLALHN